MKKILIRVAIVLVVLLIAAVVAIGLSLDKIVKKAVETAGPTITKVDVKLASVNLSILSGSGSLHGFELGNPPGYSSPTSFQFDNASLALQPSSLMSDKIVINHVRLDAPIINFEGSLRGNNFKDLLKGMQSGEKTSKPETPAGEKAQAEASRKLQVDEFSLTGARVNAKIKELGGEIKSLVIPDIKLTNLGTGPDGITGKELAELVTKEVLKKTIDALMKSDGNLDKLGQSALDDLEKSGNKDAADAIRGAIDLFKKKN